MGVKVIVDESREFFRLDLKYPLYREGNFSFRVLKYLSSLSPKIPERRHLRWLMLGVWLNSLYKSVLSVFDSGNLRNPRVCKILVKDCWVIDSLKLVVCSIFFRFSSNRF